MNKDNQDSTSGNTPGFFPPSASTSLIQKRNGCPAIVNLEDNLHEPLQQLSIPGNAPGSFPEWSETTSSFVGSQSASTTRALYSQLQQADSNPEEELRLQTRYQHGDRQTSSSGKSLGSIAQHPRSSTSNFSRNQLTSTLTAPCFHLQQTGSNPEDALSLQTLFQHEQLIPSSGKSLGSVSQLPLTTKVFVKTLIASTSGAPSCHSQQTDKHPTGALPLQTRFQHDQQTSSAGKCLRSVSPHSRTISNFSTNQSASTLGASSSYSQEQAGSNPVEGLHLQTQSQYHQHASSAEKSLGSISQDARTTECVIEDQFTSTESECIERFPQLTSLLISSSKRQTYELSSPSKKQKTRTLYCDTQSEFASRKYETATHSKQEAKNFSYGFETLALREKTTAVSLGNKEEKHSTPVKTMTASMEQVTSDRPKQQTGLCPILGETESSSSESSLNNSFSKDYKVLQSTGIEKDIDELVERLKQFDKFRCVKCRAKFATQDKLLKHEPIHFNN